MRICVLTPSPKPTGGGSFAYMYYLINALRNLGHDVSVVCEDTPDNRKYNKHAVFVRLPALGVFKILLFSLIAVFKTPANKYDLFLFDTSRGLFFNAWLRLLGKKTLGISHGCFLLYWKETRKSPAYPGGLLSFQAIATYLFERLDIKIASQTLCKSENAAKIWMRLGIRPEKLFVVAYGVDLQFWKPLKKDAALVKKYGLAGKKVVAYIGKLDYFRNVDVLLKAFARVKHDAVKSDAVLLVVGSGPLEKDLRVLAGKLGNRVVFAGFVNDERELLKTYNLADVGVIPHIAGSTFVYYAACGVPIVTVRDDLSISTTISNNLMRLAVVAEPDEKSLAGAVERLLKNENARRKISAAELAEIKKHSWSRIAEQIVDRTRRF